MVRRSEICLALVASCKSIRILLVDSVNQCSGRNKQRIVGILIAQRLINRARIIFAWLTDI